MMMMMHLRSQSNLMLQSEATVEQALKMLQIHVPRLANWILNVRKAKVVTVTHPVMIEILSSAETRGMRPPLHVESLARRARTMNVMVMRFALGTLPATTKVPSSVEHPLMMHRQRALRLAALQLIVLLAKHVSHSLPAVHPKQICQLSPSIVGQHLRKHPCLVPHPVQVESTPTVRMISYVIPILHVLSAIRISAV
jgi:hypothetical protein